MKWKSNFNISMSKIMMNNGLQIHNNKIDKSIQFIIKNNLPFH